MTLLSQILVGLVAVVHVGFLVLEMFLWNTPGGRARFGTTPEFAAESSVLAANQGLYNGILAAGLVYSLFAPGDVGFHFKVFFLVAVIIAGLYGGATVTKRILVLQATPAALALVAVLLSR